VKASRARNVRSIAEYPECSNRTRPRKVKARASVVIARMMFRDATRFGDRPITERRSNDEPEEGSRSVPGMRNDEIHERCAGLPGLPVWPPSPGAMTSEPSLVKVLQLFFSLLKDFRIEESDDFDTARPQTGRSRLQRRSGKKRSKQKPRDRYSDGG
jgi:hypothetical protein